MNTTLKPLIATAALLLSLSTAATGQQSPAAPEPAPAAGLDAKQVRIEPAAGALQLDVTGVKPKYAIGEPIQFEVRGNRTFYLWAYARDPRGDAVLLVPSPAQTGNKYQGGWIHSLPNPGLKILADEAGPHEITLIASTRWLDIDPARVAKAGADGLFTAKAAALDSAFDEKSIRIQRDGNSLPTANADTVIRRMTFEVSGDRRRPGADSSPPATGAALPFVRMDRVEYRLGERFRLVFGATEDGYVHVFLREPGGDLVRVTGREVLANRAYEETGTITEPAGSQRMVVLFSRDGRLPANGAAALDAKGVMLDRPQPTADFAFTVRR
ncbi:MAG: DUF4384 domain-containing protein [Candidatus Competibacter sp.]|jgi:hypothetical protein|nr:DUF4384 domain-containing protein [Candidatus Competibacter sp.]